MIDHVIAQKGGADFHLIVIQIHDSGAKATTISKSQYPGENAVYHNRIFARALELRGQLDEILIGHEIGHILLENGGAHLEPSDGDGNNLMMNGPWLKSERKISDTKRLLHEQIKIMEKWGVQE